MVLGTRKRYGAEVALGAQDEGEALSRTADVPGHLSTQEELIDALLFRRDAGPVRATYVRGQRLESGGGTPSRS